MTVAVAGRTERGASMIFVAAALFVLIGVAALAVDLSGLRLDRAIDQRVTDAAATAGAIAVFESDGQVGCQAALGYLALNAPEISEAAFVGYPCSSIPTTCSSADPASIETTTVGRFTISVVHPVPDGHPLMTSAAVGAPTQSVTAGDLDQCDRIGVEVAADRETTFGRVLGSDQNTTTVHSVGIAYQGANALSPVNLLILDRTACQTVRASGNGGIIVGAVIDGADLLPGWGAADSDGSGCGAGQGVFFKDGNPSVLRADGPTGCATDNPLTPSVGEGCGLLQTLAPTTPGVCNPTGCQANGPPASVPMPFPTTMSARLTRQPIDHRYNCVPDYDPVGGLNTYGNVSWASDPLTAPLYDIAGCTGGTAYVYNLIDLIGDVGTPPGFTLYGGSCTQASSDPAVSLSGNYFFDCPVFEVRTSTTIDGNAVFAGDVQITGNSGLLEIDSSDGFAFFRDGSLTKDGQGNIRFLETFVYFSKTSGINLSGSDLAGELRWTAPMSGSFEDLALWSDSPATHFWAGQSVLDLRGAFFTPWALAEYAGQGSQKQVSAQFIAARLHARGQGALVLSPNLSQVVPVDPPIVTELIR